MAVLGLKRLRTREIHLSIGSHTFVLPEFYHHLVYVKGLDTPSRIEGKDANSYVGEFLRKRYS
jgi:hypothetical protein